MFFKKISVWVLITFFIIPCVSADSIRISQIDSVKLFLNQEVKLYLSVIDNQGDTIKNLNKDNFRIMESVNGEKYFDSDGITGFQVGANYETGVNFLLLIDNSESMYWTMEGKKTDNASLRRITHAKKAIAVFLKSITNPNDKVGLAVYNTYYRLLSEPVKGTTQVEQILDNIERPTRDAIYTEIYGGLAIAVEEFQNLKGRKAIIILSDGVNNPGYRHLKKINPQFGQKDVPFEKPLEELQREGISLYVINFGPENEKKDRNLIRIAQQSGGLTFNAHNQKQLQHIYLKIMDQILNEYVVNYRATMDPAEKKYVRVKYTNDKTQHSASRVYFASSVFGNASKSVNLLGFLAFIIACLLLWLMSKLRFERQSAQPTIEVMNSGAGSPSTQILTLGNEQTIIGSAPESDMTIIGIPEIENQHATITYDQKKNLYQLVGKTKLMVNNQIVTTKILESGDLINLNGMTLVFDAGSEKKEF
ncbi:MAG: VWA domain-containing protein [SAR324 cluster bacterium]|nr:VWA domain-containing protein [SAR324 cluster bacterium]